MSNENIQNHRELVQFVEDQVRQWLERSGAVYSTRIVSKGEFIRTNVDFLVYQPYPIAIEVAISSNFPKSRFYKFKRLLADRIILSESVGTRIPFIVVIPESASETNFEDFPFVDDVFKVNQLPDFNSLPNIIELNPIVQNILYTGDPGQIEFFSNDDVDRLWRDSFFGVQGECLDKFPEYSLAYKIQEYLFERLYEKFKKFSKPSPTNNYKLLWDEDPFKTEIMDFRKFIISDEQLNKKIWNSVRLIKIDKLVHKFVVDKFGGYIKKVQIPLSNSINQNPRMSTMVWINNWGEKTAIRLMQTDIGLKGHKAKEMFADAWILRSLGSLTPDGLVLLLSTSENKEYQTIIESNRMTPIDTFIVNTYQSAGWRVFPWDFALEKPEFIKYLNYRKNFNGRT